MTENSSDLKHLKYEKEGDGVVITGFQGEPETLVIPDKIDGLPVVKIRDEAFDGCKSLTSIALPEGITEIGAYAFDGCAGLTSITLPRFS